MTGNIRTNRPARAAIAAVLALTATPLLAQTVTPPSAPTVTPEISVPPVAPQAAAPAPAQAAPASVQFTPSQPVVQTTAPVEERIAAATAAAEAEQASTRTESRRAEPRAAAPVRAAPVRSAQAAPTPPPAAATPAPVAPIAAPDPAPVTQAQEAPATASTPAPVAEPARSDQALLWALGGGALLLLGLGGTALMRRRRHADVQDDMAYVPEVAPVAAAPVAMEPAPVAPRPAMAPVSQRVSEDATLEAMVAAPPSADNPFRTRTKRLRRAQYLLAQRDAAPAVATPAPQTVHAEPAPTPAVDRSQTVYRFGNERPAPGFLKPRTR